MAWIESHQSLQHHHKTVVAADILNISRIQLIGHLQCLWWWGLDNASADGRLSKNITPAMLAAAAEFPAKKSDVFVNALLTCGGDKPGFLDLVDGVYFLHDWYDYAGKLAGKRERKREENRHGGLKRMANLTPAERSELAKKAAFQRWNASEHASALSIGMPAEMPATVPTKPTVPTIPGKEKQEKEKGITAGEKNAAALGKSGNKSLRTTTEADFLEYVQETKIEFPDLDCEVEFKKFTLYWGEGRRKLQRPKLAWRNWLEKARQIKNERSANGGTGTDKFNPRRIPGQYTRPEDLH